MTTPGTPLSAERIAGYRATALISPRSTVDEIMVELCDSHELLRGELLAAEEQVAIENRAAVKAEDELAALTQTVQAQGAVIAETVALCEQLQTGSNAELEIFAYEIHVRLQPLAGSATPQEDSEAAERKHASDEAYRSGDR